MDKATVAGPTGDAPISATIENGHEEDDIDKSFAPDKSITLCNTFIQQ